MRTQTKSGSRPGMRRASRSVGKCRWLGHKHAQTAAIHVEIPIEATSTRFRSDLPTPFRSKRKLQNVLSMCNLASSNAEERQFCRDNRPAAVGRGSEGLDAIILKRRFLLKSDAFINRTIRHEMTLRAATMQPTSFIFRSSLRIDGSFPQS